MLRAHWPDLAKRKARKFLDDVAAEHGTLPKLTLLKMCYEKFDLSLSFLHQIINGRAGKPSSRTLTLLGFEVFVRDIETGEEEKLKLIGYQCDGPITSPHFFNESRTTRKDQFTGNE